MPHSADQTIDTPSGRFSFSDTGSIESAVPTAHRLIFTQQYLGANPPIAAQRAPILRRTDPAAFVNACRALRDLDYSTLAARVTATPPELAEKLHTLIAGSTLLRLPGIAHAPQLQDPEGFIAATQPFLEGT